MSKYRYRIICEVYEDDQLIRRMEESRDKFDNDNSDGEVTMGALLSFVPAWFEANTIGGGGLMTIASMARHLAYDDRDLEPFRTIGQAFDDWGTSHAFHSCIRVLVDRERLECGAIDCDHRDKT